MFHVSELHRSKSKQGGPILFRNVHQNHGDCYNVGTGLFTAPQTGLYWISASVKSHRSLFSVICHIVVDGKPHIMVQGDHDGGSGYTVVWLTADQTVWLKAISPLDLYFRDDVVFRGLLL